MRRRALLAALAAGAAVGLAGCGVDGPDDAATGSTTLSVYVGLPLQGVAGPESVGLLQGAKLALAQAGGRVGPFTVKVAALDDSTGSSGRWDADTTAENARRTIRDRTTIAYIGDSDAGATAITLPLTNAAGILQVSPRATYAGLTTAAGGGTGEPARYRPSGVQSFVRVVPQDAGQVAALEALRARSGCDRVAVLADADLGPAGLSASIARTARGAGADVVARRQVSSADEVAPAVRAVAGSGADCAVYAAGPSAWTPDLLDRLHAAAPELELLGSDGVASAGVPPALDDATQARLTVATPAPTTTPAVFAAAYRRAYGRAPTPTAVYGFEAMRVVLRAVADAGADGGNRRRVIRAAGQGTVTGLPLGDTTIDTSGDVARQGWSVAGVRGGTLVDLRRAPGASAR